RATGARAVVHTHAVHATAVSTLVDELPPVHYMAAALGGPVRVAPYAPYGTDELAEYVLHALRDRSGCLLRNHGTLTHGATLDQAYDRTAQLEWMCRLWLTASSVPGLTPTLLTREQVAEVGERLRGYGQPGCGGAPGRGGGRAVPSGRVPPGEARTAPRVHRPTGPGRGPPGHWTGAHCQSDGRCRHRRDRGRRRRGGRRPTRQRCRPQGARRQTPAHRTAAHRARHRRGPGHPHPAPRRPAARPVRPLRRRRPRRRRPRA